MKFQRKNNEYTIDGEIVTVKSISKGKVYFFFIDKSDLGVLENNCWNVREKGNTFYVTCMDRSTRKILFLHRVILGTKKGTFVDHIDGDGLNNLRCNLRECSLSQNSRNKLANRTNKLYSKYKGVTSSYKPTKPFRATIFFNGKRISLGLFHKEEDAAIAYNKAALKYFGEFAKLNVIDNYPKKEYDQFNQYFINESGESLL